MFRLLILICVGLLGVVLRSQRSATPPSGWLEQPIPTKNIKNESEHYKAFFKFHLFFYFIILINLLIHKTNLVKHFFAF
jgi:hypothetical protein